MRADCLKFLTSLILFVQLLMPTNAAAMSGNDVINECAVLMDIDKATEDQLLPAMRCAGFVSGLDDGIALMQGLLRHNVYCRPEAGLELQQTLRIFLKWLEEHPEALHETARILFLSAMKEAFPCS